MKISRLELAALVLTAAFLAFSAGWLARGTGDAPPVRIETERTLSGEEDALVLPAPTPESAPPEDASAVPASPEGKKKIDLNTATAEELETLPGIGAERARNIIADREANGPFRIVEDLTRVPGIGEGILAGLLDDVTV